MNKVFALVDCNNFYASCERLFRPKLKNKPIVVLSNNDGCIVARSNEAKALGIRMGAPYFKNKAFIKKHNIHVFSSNYSLYGDLSHRVMEVLQELEPEVEIYSIDEAFISLPTSPDLAAYAGLLKAKVEQNVGIPVSIGIAKTKTLAKVANRIAKKNPEHKGVFTIADEGLSDLLGAVEVNGIWGIGSKSTEKLNRVGIYNALQLKNADDNWVRKNLSITGLRTVMELRGTSCIALDQSQALKKTIISSRTFGQPIYSLAVLKEAIAHHVSIASKKLRDQGSVASAIHIFIFTNRYIRNEPQHSGNVMITLPQASSYTPTMIKFANQGLEEVFKPGFKYNKAGVMMTGIVGSNSIQRNLFFSPPHENKTLMDSVDRINAKFGHETIRYAGVGFNNSWRMKQSHKSPAYTTKWNDLPIANCS
jgi:DNA polymerase V